MRGKIFWVNLTDWEEPSFLDYFYCKYKVSKTILDSLRYREGITKTRFHVECWKFTKNNQKYTRVPGKENKILNARNCGTSLAKTQDGGFFYEIQDPCLGYSWLFVLWWVLVVQHEISSVHQLWNRREKYAFRIQESIWTREDPERYTTRIMYFVLLSLLVAAH